MTTTATITRDFALAGRAVFTVSNPAGDHYTYRIAELPARDGYGRQETAFAAFVLTGPDNTSDYTYVGMVDTASGRVRLTAKSRFTPACRAYRVLAWALSAIWAGRDLPPGYAIQHAGRCGRCGRMLSDPVSCSTGLGPECRHKMGLVAASASLVSGALAAADPALASSASL